MAGDAEVVVVGGGPAGAAVAARLSRAGIEVLVLERAASFPRPKPCGESLSPGAIEELRQLGAFDRLLALPHARIEGWRVHPVDRRPFVGRFPAGLAGICVDRGMFDGALLDAAREAGAAVAFGARVGDVLVEEGRVAGVTLADGSEVRAPLVIGADGLRSVVTRRLGFVRPRPRLRKLALTAHVVLPREPCMHPPPRSFHRSGRAACVMPPEEPGLGELHLHRWGCVGIVSIGGGRANVVIVLDSGAAPSLAGDRDGYFDERIRALPYLGGAERVSPVRATGPFDFPGRRAVTDGAMVVGDAAGYYDPFTGQGIFRALRGARLAADSAHRAVRSGDTSRASLLEYERRHRRAFAGGIRFQHLIEFGLARPALFGLAAVLLRSRPRLADRIVAVTGDARPVRSLLLPTLHSHL